jgi:hypothetical protein
MVIPSSGSNQETPEELPPVMDMLIAAGLALVSGVDFDGPFELEAGAIAFSVHFPAFKVEIVIQYEGAHHAHWEFDLNRPSVARLHRLGGHITVCAHQLLEITLANTLLRGASSAGDAPVDNRFIISSMPSTRWIPLVASR